MKKLASSLLGLALALAAVASHAQSSDTSIAATNVHSFTLGKLVAVALKDGDLQVPNDGKTIAIHHSPQDTAKLLSAAGVATDHLDLSIQPLLVKAGQRVLLFDTGAGASMGATAGRLSASLAAASIDPNSVTDIFISHAHGDHVGGLVNAQGALAFPQAAVHISQAEWDFLQGLDEKSAYANGITNFAALIPAITPKVVPFKADSVIVPGVVKAVDIKGHTPGHSGYLITSGNASLLYIGDAMHHSIVSVQEPDWTIAFDRDAKTAEASRKALLARTAASGQLIYAVHFPFPGIGKFVRKDDHFVWQAQ